MSFFDEARAQHQSARDEEQRDKTRRKIVAGQIINRPFTYLEKELYLGLRQKGLASYANAGMLSDLDYSKRWTISMDFQEYDSDVVESHIKSCMQRAFMQFVREVNGTSRLLEYHRPGRYGGKIIQGYEILTFRTSPDPRNDSDWSPSPGSFEVTLHSRFSPPLTG